jgi:hypothetical protein
MNDPTEEDLDAILAALPEGDSEDDLLQAHKAAARRRQSERAQSKGQRNFREECFGPFCACCGDCIKCFAEDPCYGNDGGAHVPPREDDIYACEQEGTQPRGLTADERGELELNEQ